MAETDLERCARALYESALSLPENDGCVKWARADDKHKGYARKHAQALLSVLREPSETMIEAGHREHWGSDLVSDESERANVRAIFRAMIDAALVEKA